MIEYYELDKPDAPPASVRNVLETAPSKDSSDVIKLVHRSAGWQCAGSAATLVNEAWGALYEAKSGSRGGQWFKTFDEAKARFDLWTKNNA